MVDGMWQPYFTGETGEEIRYRLALGDWKSARPLLEKALKESKVDGKIIRYLLAYVMWKDGDCKGALAEIERVKPRWKLMAPGLAAMEATCAVDTGEYERAERAARSAFKNDTHRPDAVIVLGGILGKQSRWDEARKVYTDFLNDSPSARIAEARYRLAESIEKTSGELSDILNQLRLIERDYPVSRWSRLAQNMRERLLKGAPEDVRNQWLELPCSFVVERAERLMRVSRYSQARKELQKFAEKKGDCSAADHCRAAYNYAQTFFRTRKRSESAPLFERAVDICDNGGSADIRAKAKYQAGRSNRFRRRFVRARNYFRRVEREHPNHSYADDAALRLAETWELDDQPDKATETYKTLIEKYPKGDMRPVAMWRLVREAYLKGDMKESLRLLQWGRAIRKEETGPHAEGRMLYWTARVLEKKGHKGKALLKYEAVLKNHPLTYYAWLASGRLRNLDESRLKTFVDERRKIKRGSIGDLLSNMGEDPVFREPGFLRAVENARMGLGNEALAELRSVGIRIFQGPPSAARGIKLDKKSERRLWAAVALLDSAGLYNLSHWTPRHLLSDFMSTPPDGESYVKWELAYPNAYGPLVREAASRFNIPVELLFAVMREESAFNPVVVSRANAIGLTQLLVPTAERFARGMNLRVNAASLKNAQINVPIGARYLRYLLNSFEGSKVPAVASYNAGENRLVRWIKRHKELELDEFVELIPFDQTRHYTKRVMGSAFAYRYFANPEDPFLPVDFKLPTPSLGPMPPLSLDE